MEPIERIRRAVEGFEAVTWANCGYPLESSVDESPTDAGWVKFGLEKSETGWRTLEFLAWLVNDMVRAGERLHFFPTAPPPYLNEPGACLSFVLECYPYSGDMAERFQKVSEFIEDCHRDYWTACKGPRNA